MRKIILTILITLLLPSFVLATTITIYSGAGDGDKYECNADWDTIHDATSADYGDHTTANEELVGISKNISDNYCIWRGFLPFDTSSIPDDATITDITLNINVTNIKNDDDDGDDWINVVQSSQASPTALVDNDFNDCGAVNNPTEGATRIDIGDVVDDTYNTWTLNATGIGWASTTGWTYLGLREGHDAIDSPFVGGLLDGNQIYVDFSETAGTSTDPYLEITYTEAGAGSEISTSTVISGGNIKINSGRLIIK